MLGLVLLAFLAVVSAEPRAYYNVRHQFGPQRGQFMRRRTADEVKEYNQNGFIRRGELRSRQGSAGYDLRRNNVLNRWAARGEQRQNGFVRRGEFRTRSSDPVSYARRRDDVMARWNARLASRTTKAPTAAPTPAPKPSDVWWDKKTGGYATREFIEKRDREEREESNRRQMEKFREEIAWRSTHKYY